MTYYFTVGCEFEIANKEPLSSPRGMAQNAYNNSDFTPYRERWDNERWADELSAAGFDWVQCKDESTSGIAAEIITPPMADCPDCREDIARLLTWIDNKGGRGQRQFKAQQDITAGLHIHIGVNMQDGDIHPPSEFWRSSKRHMAATGNHYAGRDFKVMDLMLAKDVITRWADNWDVIQSMLPQKRRATHRNWMATSITHVAEGGREHNAFMAETDAKAAKLILARDRDGKFAAVSLDTWARLGTIEFRQPSCTLDHKKLWGWIDIITTAFKTSMNGRITPMASAQTLETPAQLFRRGSRVAVLYSMMRSEGGATTRALISATGWDADTIRARASEIRSKLHALGINGDVAVENHSQQEYGHRYGSSAGQYDLGGYEVLREVTATRPCELLPANRRAPASIWYGISDELFEFWQARIEALR